MNFYPGYILSLGKFYLHCETPKKVPMELKGD